MSRELREEAQRRAEERERIDRRREEFARDVRSLAGTAEGRRLFRWFIEQGRIFADEFQPGPTGVYQAGCRATAVRLWQLLREILPEETFAAVVLRTDKE